MKIRVICSKKELKRIEKIQEIISLAMNEFAIAELKGTATVELERKNKGRRNERHESNRQMEYMVLESIRYRTANV